MKVTRRFLALLLSAFAVSSQAEAATMRLSIEDALKMAHERNTSIKAVRARIDQADARIVQSRQAYLPKVKISETWLHTTDPGANLVFKLQQGIVTAQDFDPNRLNHPAGISDFQTSLEVMQPLYNADAHIGRSIAVTARKAQVFMADRAVENIDLYVKKAYYGMILATKNLADIEQSIVIMQAYSREAARGYSAGLLTKSDKLSTDVRLAELREQKLMMQDEIRNAGDALRMMLGLNADDTLVPSGDLAPDPKLPAGAAGASHAGRSDLKALDAFREVTGFQYDMARAQYMPRVNAFAQQNWHDSSLVGLGGSGFTIGVNVQWNIYDGMATKGKVQEAKAQELEARYNYEAAKEQGELEVNKARRALASSVERIAVSKKSLEEARVSFDFIGQQYKTGMAMTFELLMREGAYTWAKLRFNQARYDYSVAKSELDFYSGH
ncbi:MAG: TolC family protein [Chlorobiaceae bacterium]|nr:TolC family protein [Chlorobiaceae bacterium]